MSNHSDTAGIFSVACLCGDVADVTPCEDGGHTVIWDCAACGRHSVLPVFPLADARRLLGQPVRTIISMYGVPAGTVGAVFELGRALCVGGGLPGGGVCTLGVRWPGDSVGLFEYHFNPAEFAQYCEVVSGTRWADQLAAAARRTEAASVHIQMVRGEGVLVEEG